MVVTLQGLQAQADQLALSIRQRSEAQYRLWRQLPNLALEANGRTGWSGDLTTCTGYGIWSLSAEGFLGHHNALAVDCATGRLMKGGGVNSFQKASDQQVLWLASRLALINVTLIIGYLSEKAQQPRPSYITESEWADHEERREIERLRLGLGYDKPYVRQRSPVVAGA